LARKKKEYVGGRRFADAREKREDRNMEITNALDNEAEIAKVQEWLGHANISTTRIYDHRKTKPEDSPTF
jgi:integrase